ncbi:hypothetical protein AQUCO_00500638v1 [Aquilegia coerulea]|uniref:BED-type domain-containing protein n=1 Tax=Aquilegia coerulea TaxID=218851 RepID=A0A2G5ESX3_AQUCA|nr:hypothetical protein AQUCO_00500638v1 [Aquilegia coerulea]
MAKRDIGWEYGFVESSDETGIVCGFCEKKMRGGGVTRFKGHLAGVGNDVTSCTKVLPDVRLRIQASATSISATSSSSEDSKLLISFKLALQNPNLLSTWQTNQDPCYFTGVICKTSRVSSIDLSSINLNLDFNLVSSYLLSLQQLERLSLKKTNLTGNLTSAAWKSTSCSEMLAEIDLAENNLSGSISDISSLSGCKSLRFLNLSRNLGFSSNQK